MLFSYIEFYENIYFDKYKLVKTDKFLIDIKNCYINRNLTIIN